MGRSSGSIKVSEYQFSNTTSQRKLNAFITHYMKTFSIEKAAKEVGVSKWTGQTWMQVQYVQEQIDDALAKARKQAEDRLIYGRDVAADRLVAEVDAAPLSRDRIHASELVLWGKDRAALGQGVPLQINVGVANYVPEKGVADGSEPAGDGDKPA